MLTQGLHYIDEKLNLLGKYNNYKYTQYHGTQIYEANFDRILKGKTVMRKW